MIKRLFIDVETTGLNSYRHGIWNLGAIMMIDDHIVDRLELKFRPHQGKLIDDNALAVSNITKRDLAAMPMKSPEAFVLFTRWIEKKVSKYDKTDKAIFMAYNASFDVGFVRQWYKDNGHKYFGSHFWSGHVCVMSQALNKFAGERPQMQNFKLATVCNHLGIQLHEAHDALSDIMATIQVWKRCQ